MDDLFLIFNGWGIWTTSFVFTVQNYTYSNKEGVENRTNILHKGEKFIAHHLQETLQIVHDT